MLRVVRPWFRLLAALRPARFPATGCYLRLGHSWGPVGSPACLYEYLTAVRSRCQAVSWTSSGRPMSNVPGRSDAFSTVLTLPRMDVPVKDFLGRSAGQRNGPGLSRAVSGLLPRSHRGLASRCPTPDPASRILGSIGVCACWGVWRDSTFSLRLRRSCGPRVGGGLCHSVPRGRSPLWSPGGVPGL